jgi:hypothetical protein
MGMVGGALNQYSDQRSLNSDSHNRKNNYGKILKFCENYQNLTQGTEGSIYWLKNDADRLA